MRWVLAALAGVSVALVFAAAARAEVVWLCKPGMEAANPCEIPQDTTRQRPTGDQVETPEPGPRKVDCFYVYPTVSNQLTKNADKSRDPELVSIAKYQAARFSLECRVFAPIYRQGTLYGISGGIFDSGQASYDVELAYGDVEEAWRQYMRRYNDGRGVVLVSHSQGTRMLRLLVAREIERKPAQRRRLVSGLLTGGNVTVPEGKLLGADFKRTPLCTKPFELGCIVAYSTFAEDPPEDARFGVPTEPGTEIACTDPRKLARWDRPYEPLVPAEEFAPGPIQAGFSITWNGSRPTAETTWVAPPDRYEGDCREINGADVLRLEPTPGSETPSWFPVPGWGTHLIDVNIALDPLVALVARQAQRWTDPEVTLKRRCGAAGGMKLRLRGPEAELIEKARFTSRGRTLVRDTSAPFRAALDPRQVAAAGPKIRARVALAAGAKRRLGLTARTCG